MSVGTFLLPSLNSQSLEQCRLLFVERMSDFDEYDIKAVGCFKWESRIIRNILSGSELLLLVFVLTNAFFMPSLLCVVSCYLHNNPVK